MQRTIPLRLLQIGALAALAAAFAAAAARSATVSQHLSAVNGMALVAAVSAAYLALQIDLAWTFSVGIALAVFSGNSQYIGLPIGPDRLVIGFAMATLLWRSRPWADREVVRVAPSVRFGLVSWLLALTIAFAVVSAAWTGTLLHHAGLYSLLDRLGVVPFLVFMLAPTIFATERQRMALVTTLVVLGAYLGFTALAEALHLDALVFPRYILNPSVGIHADRARGPFVEAVANGMGLFACATAAAVALVRWRDAFARAVALGVMVLCALGIVFTLTRAVWLASAIAPMIALVCSPRTRRWALPAAVIGAVIVVGAFATVPGLSASADSRAQAQRPVWDRLNTDAAALRMIEARPLLGFGWSSFVERGPEYLRQDAAFPLTGAGLNVHNVFLSNAVELGLVGGAVWLAAFLGGIGGAALRRVPAAVEPWRLGLIALAVNWVIVASFGPLGYAFPTLLLWAWAGLVWASRSVPPVAAVGTQRAR
jgi:putative inorganic carbon (hco3(-)) transporter